MAPLGFIKSGSPWRYLTALLTGLLIIALGGLTAYAINFLQISLIRKMHSNSPANYLFLTVPFLISIFSILFAGFVAGRLTKRNGFIVGIAVGSFPALLVIFGYFVVYLLPAVFTEFHYKSVDLLARIHLPTSLIYITPYIPASGIAGWLGEKAEWKNGLHFRLRKNEQGEELFQDY